MGLKLDIASFWHCARVFIDSCIQSKLLLLCPELSLTDIRPCSQLKCNLFCKDIMHGISRMQTVEPEVLINRNRASSIKVIISWSTTAKS
jgi:hypothetical protein